MRLDQYENFNVFAEDQTAGTSSYTFHGGEHSRFSHCLGVYEIARRITEILKRSIPQEWSCWVSLDHDSCAS